MTDLTPERLDELEALRHAAMNEPYGRNEINHAYMVRAAVIFPALIAEVRRLRGELAEIKAQSKG